MFKKKTLISLVIATSIVIGSTLTIGYGLGNGLREETHRRLLTNIDYPHSVFMEDGSYSIYVSTLKDGSGLRIRKENYENDKKIILIDKKKHIPLIEKIPLLRNITFGNIDEIKFKYDRYYGTLEKINGKYPTEYEDIMDEILKEIRSELKKEEKQHKKRRQKKLNEGIKFLKDS